MAIVRDPGLVNLRRGLRAAVVVPLLYGATGAMVGSTAALYAAFGSFASMVFADFQGPARRRLEGYGSLAVLGTALVLLGSAVAEVPVAPAVAIFAVTFVIRFAGCLGGYAIAAGTTLMLAFALAVMSTPVTQVDQRAVGWLLGCVAAAGASMIAPLPRRSIARDRLAAHCRALAAHLTARADGRPTTPPDVTPVREVREELARSVARPLTPTVTQTALSRLLDVLGRATIIDAHIDPTSDLAAGGTGTDELARAAASTFTDAARTIEGDPTAHPTDVRAALAAQRANTVALLTDGDAAHRRAVEEAAATSMRLRIVTALAGAAVTSATVWQGGRPPADHLAGTALALPEGGMAAFRHRAERTLRFHLRWQSTRFRNSLRAGVAVAAALVVARAVAFDHAFWVVLGTLMVLRSGASDTTTTAMQALRGTLVGFAVAAPLAIASGDREWIFWALIPFASFLAAWAPGAVGLGSGQAAFTLFVVVLFGLAVPQDTQTAVVRVETVATGIAVAVVAGFLFWPRGPRASLGPAGGRLYRASAALLRAVSAESLGLTHDPSARTASRRELVETREQIEETLRELAAADLGRVDMPHRLAMLAPPALVEAGDWSRADLAAGSVSPDEGRPTTPPRAIEAEAFEVAARLDEVAAALAGPGPPDAVSFPARTGEGPPRPDARGREPAEFLRQVWLWTWLGIVDDSVRRTAEETVTAVGSLPRSWWR